MKYERFIGRSKELIKRLLTLKIRKCGKQIGLGTQIVHTINKECGEHFA